MTNRAPNLLLLMVDQLTPGALPAYGNTVCRTPEIDALAATSVVFDAAYCNSPLCAPSRYVFMSGRLPARIGAWDNAAELPSEVPTFGHHLRRAGYRTILSGKMHFCGADQLHGFEERLTTDIYPADFGWFPDWSRPDHRPSWYHNMGSVIDAGPCVRTNQLDFDDEVVFQAERRLHDLARERDRRPFCLVVSMTHPHDPYAISRPWWDLYEGVAIDPPRVPEGGAPDDPHSRRLRHVMDLDRTPVSLAQTLRARRAYYGSISYVDAQIGRLRRTLADCGLADDTVTVFLGDHGDMLGERGLWYKMNYFEPACRIPLMVHAPTRFAPARVREAVSLVDLLPTLVDLAALPAAAPAAAPLPSAAIEEIDGRSLLPHVQGRGGHDEVIGEYFGEGAVAPLLMLRRGPWKFVHSPVDPDQLYHLGDDPLELHNLAVEGPDPSPAVADVLAAFRAECAARWDCAALDRAVRASQRRRAFVVEALAQGRPVSWDHQPHTDASQQYMRNHIDLDDLEARARFPLPQRGD
ncbi:MAG: Choline-sulfatase [Pseudomonadota bacterium]|jgi:choline-sulfatase